MIKTPSIDPSGSRLNEAIASYMMRCDAGELQPRTETLAEFADVARELKAFFADEDAVGPAVQTGPSDSADADEPSPLELIGRFDDLELIEQVGRGGMGVVYKARQTRLGRFVALKMARRGRNANPEAMLDEARRVATLTHPNIVPIYDAGSHQGIAYFFMEFVEGETLKSRARDRPLPPRQAARYIGKLSRAVQYIHGQGMLHRDIKPSNVIIDNSDEPRLTDFGLAQWRVQSDAERRFVGTLGYVAPEQARGEEDAAATSDVYSLGATLYEALAGGPPFVGSSSHEILRQLLQDDPVSPATVNRSIPKDLELICLNCLHRDPLRRYPSAAELADDLDRFLNDEPVLARPVNWPTRLGKWCRRHPQVAALAILLFLAMATGLAFATAAWRQTSQALRRETKAVEEKSAALRAKNEAFVKAEIGEYGLAVRQAHYEWKASNPTAARTHLDESPTEHRGWEWHYCDQLFASELLTLGRGAVKFDAIAFSPDGKLVAAAGQPELLEVWNAETGSAVHSLGGFMLANGDCLPRDPTRVGSDIGQNYALVKFSFDGKRLAAIQSDGRIAIWDLAAEKAAIQIPADDRRPLELCWSHDGDLIGVASQAPLTSGRDQTAHLRVFSARDAGLRFEATLPTEVIALAFSAEDNRIVAACGDRVLRSYAMEGAASEGKASDAVTLERVEAPISSGVFSESLELFAAGLSNTVLLWDARTGRRREAFAKRHIVQESFSRYSFLESWDAVALSPSGRFLAAGNEDRIIQIWDTKTEKIHRTLRGHDTTPTALCFDRSETRLAVAERFGPIRIWDFTNHQDYQIVHGLRVLSDAFGHRFRLSSNDGVVMASDRAPSVVVASLAGSHRTRFYPSLTSGAAPVRCVAISHDEASLASATEDGQIQLWNMATGARLRRLEGLRDRLVTCIEFSPDATHVAVGVKAGSAASEVSGAVIIWSATTGEMLREIACERGVRAVAFASSERLLYATVLATYRYDFGTHQVTRMPPSLKDATSIAVCPPRNEIAFAAGRQVEVWRSDTGRRKFSMSGHSGNVRCVAYLRNGHRLASGGEDGSVRIWNPETGKQMLTLTGHREAVTSLAFSHDGKFLASGSDDGTIRIWRAAGYRSRENPAEAALARPR